MSVVTAFQLSKNRLSCPKTTCKNIQNGGRKPRKNGEKKLWILLNWEETS
ncbi:hypothetical protein HMPREF1991_02270 [Hoylesella loescheii DSM 19665 = JCM 12249 = ATCC 15930]|uniref:Uncharacterized protein n=1 Tax=Hoylesella loescheii DSM 19665 = JCM 12249 = ATCC 15930 TaxID=1122985 RepID=A0A069QFX1_HOYLO|nr:hypothetical protein HMPREF1991_02270 [Hoylesella loescheii DSM 19665 = JCM 12249 = ATCC 15930]